MNDRIRMLKARALNSRQLGDPRAASLRAESFAQTEGQPEVLREAQALAHYFRHQDVTIQEGELLVGTRPGLTMDPTGKIVRGDIETQTEASLKAVKFCLETAGTSLDNVVMARIYAANAGFYSAINQVYLRYFPDNFPSRSFVPVAGWFMEFDIEIEVMAVA